MFRCYPWKKSKLLREDRGITIRSTCKCRCFLYIFVSDKVRRFPSRQEKTLDTRSFFV